MWRVKALVNTSKCYFICIFIVKNAFLTLKTVLEVNMKH